MTHVKWIIEYLRIDVIRRMARPAPSTQSLGVAFFDFPDFSFLKGFSLQSAVFSLYGGFLLFKSPRSAILSDFRQLTMHRGLVWNLILTG